MELTEDNSDGMDCRPPGGENDDRGGRSSGTARRSARPGGGGFPPGHPGHYGPSRDIQKADVGGVGPRTRRHDLGRVAG